MQMEPQEVRLLLLLLLTEKGEQNVSEEEI
jgi:hypothetical protein